MKSHRGAVLCLYAASLLPSCRSLSSKSPQGTVLVVGATGGTGLRALTGLLDVGYKPEQLRVLTRNFAKPSVVALQQAGHSLCQADLEVPDSEQLREAVSGCSGCYLHSTSSDTKRLDALEVDRARNLAAAIAATGDIRNIVYNSAAGEVGHGVYRIQQKHDVEQVFLQDCGSNISFTSLRANLFMEELWKKYTRPAILKGKYLFSVPASRKIYLTSVRDMGRLAGTILQATPGSYPNQINVAGDAMTPVEMADAFAKEQGSPCVHRNSRFFALIVRLFFKDLHEVIRFYKTTTETTDIEALKQQFRGDLLTSFPQFLEETHWGDSELSYEDLGAAKKVLISDVNRD
jgi:uncharacterized protein YbjT (DUF2867 family)